MPVRMELPRRKSGRNTLTVPMYIHSTEILPVALICIVNANEGAIGIHTHLHMFFRTTLCTYYRHTSRKFLEWKSAISAHLAATNPPSLEEYGEHIPRITPRARLTTTNSTQTTEVPPWHNPIAFTISTCKTQYFASYVFINWTRR